MGISRKAEKIMRAIIAVLIFALLLFGAILDPIRGVALNPVGVRNDWEAQKQDKITFSIRAPTSNDVGGIWVEYTESSDTTIYIHVRHPLTGTWRKATAS